MENRITSFKILNDTDKEMDIVHEPECFQFCLPSNEEITIETNACRDSILIRTSVENSKVILSILDDGSFYEVFYKGENVFKKYS